MAFARAKTAERVTRMSASFRGSSRAFEYQNPLKHGTYLQGNFLGKQQKDENQNAGAWDTLLSKTSNNVTKPAPKTQAFVYKQQEQKSARTLRPDLQDVAIIKPLTSPKYNVREPSEGGIVGSLMRSDDGGNITNCQRKHNAKVYQHSIQISHEPERSRQANNDQLQHGYMVASEIFASRSQRISIETNSQLKDPQAQNNKRYWCFIK